jgi:hypothetical protein
MKWYVGVMTQYQIGSGIYRYPSDRSLIFGYHSRNEMNPTIH